MEELEWRLSGGATGTGNTDPLISIGGVLTTTRILSQTPTRTTSLITGVTVDDAAGNGEGAGTMTYTLTGQTLQWTPAGGAIGTAMDISSDGSFYIQGANDGGALYVTVVAANLPNGNTVDTVTIDGKKILAWDDVTKTESDAGKTFYRCFALTNTGTVATTDDKKTIKIWINANTPGQDSISIGLAAEVPSTGAGAAGTDYPVILADDFTAAPAGVTFTSPASEATALTAFDLSSTAGSTHTKFVWEKRTVPIGVTAKETANTFSLAFSAKV